MNPPNTAQIVKTNLLALVLPSESSMNLSLTSGILMLKTRGKIRRQLRMVDTDQIGIRTSSVVINLIPGKIMS